MKKNILRGILTAAAIGALSIFTLTAHAASERWQSTTMRDENNNIRLEFEEVRVTLPESWAGNCQMGTSDSGVTFYQTKSRELWTEQLGYQNGGRLFSVYFATDDSYKNNPSYSVIGSTSEGTYYVTLPTDLQAYTDDSTAYNEFLDMSRDVEWIKSQIVLTVDESDSSDTASGTDDEYIFPQSSSEYLSKDDLAGMNDDQIQMAINEIYARHNRRFVMQSVQDYFDSKSWYSGTVDAEDFDISVMNQYEGANIGLMVEYMKN